MWGRALMRSMTVWTHGLDRAGDRLVGACVVFFFFQAEDGIRDLTVTGVQTCALPICTQDSRGTGASARGRIARPRPADGPARPHRGARRLPAVGVAVDHRDRLGGHRSLRVARARHQGAGARAPYRGTEHAPAARGWWYHLAGPEATRRALTRIAGRADGARRELARRRSRRGAAGPGGRVQRSRHPECGGKTVSGDPVRFLNAFAQALAAMALYRDNHPARERA